VSARQRSRPGVVLDLVAGAPHYLDHLAPVWHALPERVRGRFLVPDPPTLGSVDDLVARAAGLGISAEVGLEGLDHPTLVASAGELRRVREAGRSHVALLEHGIGMSYGGDPDWAHRSSYPGGRGRDADLFLHPNETSAARDRAAYPDARVEVVGCPKLDTLPAREPGPGPVIAVAFHWDGAEPELRWAWPRFRHAVVRLASRFTVIGHGHPRAMADLAPWYRRAGIEVVPDFRDVCRRADLLIFDNSSVGFEFASTGRPVVVLEPYHYRRDVHHGLRFWDAVPGLVCHDRAGVPDAVSLTAVVERALGDPPEAREARERALELVYVQRTGAAERAARVLVEWAREVAGQGAEPEDATDPDPGSPVGATVGPSGSDSDDVASVLEGAEEVAA
jgi:hypothetical protein